jgi:hypothetical protein
MSTNQEIIRKADIALSDLATAGRLNPQQADSFVRTLIDQPTLLKQVRTVTMASPTMKINKIGFGSRILAPAAQTVGAGDDHTARYATATKPDLSQVELNTKEVIAEVHIPYEVLEDNIEGGNPSVAMQAGAGGLHQTIVDLIGARAALDLEELGIQGDTSSGDAYLAMQNGFLKLATANNVAAGGPISKDVIKAGINTMPTRYLRNRAQLVNFVSVQNETEMRDVYGSRQTALGDAQLQGNLPLYMHGTPIQGVALMPQANGLFTNPLNLIFGIQRNISIEYDKDIRARVFIIVLTARIAFQIEEVNAIVKYTGIS